MTIERFDEKTLLSFERADQTTFRKNKGAHAARLADWSEEKGKQKEIAIAPDL